MDDILAHSISEHFVQVFPSRSDHLSVVGSSSSLAQRQCILGSSKAGTVSLFFHVTGIPRMRGCHSGPQRSYSPAGDTDTETNRKREIMSFLRSGPGSTATEGPRDGCSPP